MHSSALFAIHDRKNGNQSDMMEHNVFYELKETINGLKDFLDGNSQNVKAGIQAMASIMPQTMHLVDNLIYLMDNLKDTIAGADAGSIPNINELASFGQKINLILRTAVQLLPDDPYMIDDIERSSRVMSNLPSLEHVKGEILGPLDGVIGHLHELKA